MNVVKVLNNSLVLAIDEEEDEVVIMGKGIGFNTSVGDKLTQDSIEKIFVLKDKDTLKKLIQLSSETDTEYFDLSSQIIQYAKEKYDLQLRDYIYLSLTDHIAFIKKRMSSGYVFQNVFTIDLKHMNAKEFDVANYALRLLRSQIDETIPDSEAGYIAMHFIYQQEIFNQGFNYTEINKLVEDILSITKYQLQIEYDRDSIIYSRFLTHLSLFAQRLLFDQMIPNKKTDVVYDQLVFSSPKAFECLQAIEQYILEKYELLLSNQEKLYLLIHILKVYDEYQIK